MTFTVVYGEFPQTRNYFWSLKIHAKGCNDIPLDVRKYGHRGAEQHTWDYDTIREVAVDYWAAHIRESSDYYDSEEAAIQSYIEETKGAMCPCARKLLKDKSQDLQEASS
jgi:hypothetical protein